MIDRDEKWEIIPGKTKARPLSSLSLLNNKKRKIETLDTTKVPGVPIQSTKLPL